MVAHQLAPELELVLADGLRQLVHEALEEDAVLVDVHTPPEPRLDVRIAHGVVEAPRRADSSGDRPVTKPTIGITGCCARAPSGHATAAPPSSDINRRLFIQSPRRRARAASVAR